jgi:Ca2+/Na+ antiporter
MARPGAGALFYENGQEGGGGMAWIVGIIVFAVCLAIQYQAMKKEPFQRFLFITTAAFVISFVIRLSLNPAAVVLYYIFLTLTWLFVLFMTWQSIRRLRARRR